MTTTTPMAPMAVTAAPAWLPDAATTDASAAEPLRDIDGAPLGPVAAVVSAFRNMTSFEGRASRSAYWWFWLFGNLMAVAAGFAVGMGVYTVAPGAHEVLVTAVIIVALVPLWMAILTVTGRRLHDQGLGIRYLGLLLIPYLGGVAVSLLALRGPQEPNRYTPAR